METQNYDLEALKSKFETMTPDELLSEITGVSVKGTSQHGLRDENKQNRSITKYYDNKTLESAKKYKCLVINELAFPFNPISGKADIEEAPDKFNENNKYRPPMSVKTLAFTMKEFAKINPALKTTLMKAANLVEWDLDDYVDIAPSYDIAMSHKVPTAPIPAKASDAINAVIALCNKDLEEHGVSLKPEKVKLVEEYKYRKCLSSDDRKIFKKFQTERTFSFSKVSTNLATMLSGKQTNAEYMFNYVQLQDGKYYQPILLPDGTKKYDEIATPLICQIAQAEASVIKLVADEMRELNAKAPESEKLKDDDLKKKIRDIWGASEFKSPSPANYVQCLFLDLNSKFEVIETNATMFEDIAKLDNKSLAKFMTFRRKSDKITDGIKGFKDGSKADQDLYLGFYEIDVDVPPDITDPMQRGLKTTWAVSTKPLYNVPGCMTFEDRVNEFVNEEDDIETTFLNSVRFKVYDKKVETALEAAIINDSKLPAHPKLSLEIVERYKDLFYKLFGDDDVVSEFLSEIEEKELSEEEEVKAKEEEKAAIAESIKATGEFDASEFIGEDLEDEEDIDIE